MTRPALIRMTLALAAAFGLAAGPAAAQDEDAFLNLLEGMGLETTPDSEAFLRTATGEPAPLKDWSEMNRYERTAEEAFLSVMAHYARTAEDITPLPEPNNVPVSNCAAFRSEGMKANIEKRGSVEYANKADVYSALAPLHALETQDCSCAGKWSPWEPVDAIHEELAAKYGALQTYHTRAFNEEGDRLRTLVEKMCGGPY